MTEEQKLIVTCRIDKMLVEEMLKVFAGQAAIKRGGSLWEDTNQRIKEIERGSEEIQTIGNGLVYSLLRKMYDDKAQPEGLILSLEAIDDRRTKARAI